MKRWIVGLGVVVFGVAIVFAAPLTGKKIFVDPGHGGTDPGAIGPTGLKESIATLQTSLKLKDLLLNGGALVKLSRETDTYPTLPDRTNMANSWEADRFICVHYNSTSDRTVNGTETLYYTYGSETSKDLAQKLQNRLVEALKLPNRGIKPRSDLWVLKESKMPAALTESSFISNPYEESRLKDINYISKIALAHYYGILDHFGAVPEPVNPPTPQPQPQPQPQPTPALPLSDKIFVIDAANGGTSNGYTGPTGLKSKDVNLRVATVLKNNLVEYGGAKVVMTRDSDVSVSSTKRNQIVAASGAERLISVVFGGSSNPDTNYTKTYYYNDSANPTKTNISKDLATKIQQRLVQTLNLTNKGIGTSTASILANAQMPGVKVTPSFVTNPYEEARLKDSSYTWKIGRYIYLGIADHYQVNP